MHVYNYDSCMIEEEKLTESLNEVKMQSFHWQHVAQKQRALLEIMHSQGFFQGGFMYFQNSNQMIWLHS